MTDSIKKNHSRSLNWSCTVYHMHTALGGGGGRSGRSGRSKVWKIWLYAVIPNGLGQNLLKFILNGTPSITPPQITTGGGGASFIAT